MRCVIVMVTPASIVQGLSIFINHVSTGSSSAMFPQEPRTDKHVWVTVYANEKLMWHVICRKGHSAVLTEQDGGGPGESLHARHRWELSEAEGPVVFPHLQQHPHHGHHVAEHLRHKTWGVQKNIYLFFLTHQAALIVVEVKLFRGWEGVGTFHMGFITTLFVLIAG